VGLSGAQALAAGLRDAGVEVCFGLPGVHNLPLWQAVRMGPHPAPRIVGVRHEQAAAYAADGYARASGRVGVALVTTGPGAANTLGALGEAWASRSPVVVVATDVPTSLRSEGGVVRMSLHEGADQAGMARPVTKAVLEASQAAELRALARMACEVALAPPARPVWLQVPADLLRADAGDAQPLSRVDAAPTGCTVDPDAAAAAARAIESAARPLIWAGGGALADGAGAQVAALARRLGAPVLTTFSARGLLGDDPLAVGLPPHLPEVGALWDAADVVVVVGSDLDGMSTQNWRQPQPPVLVAVNVDPDDATKSYEAAHVLAASAGEGVGALLDELGGRADAPWADLGALRAAARERLRAEFPAELGFLDAVRTALPPEAVVLADMCIPGYWLAGFHQVPAPRRLQYPMGWGTLGYAFPASLGAACAAGPRAPVVSFSGDGGFLFACGELATAAQERLPLTAVVVDDGGYGMLRFDQQRTGAPPAGVDLHTPDFAALAQAFDVHAEAVDGLGAAFADALARHVADDEPSLLAVRATLQPPPTTSPRWYRPAASS
jgi:thiamine pyrophosphate-dependent acetolactate synthase large subunit-like protein